jgi:hypothetical protein
MWSFLSDLTGFQTPEGNLYCRLAGPLVIVFAAQSLLHSGPNQICGRTPAPERPRKERPQPTRANPFHEPGEVPPAIVEINLSLNDGEEPADQPALSS